MHNVYSDHGQTRSFYSIRYLNKSGVSIIKFGMDVSNGLSMIAANDGLGILYCDTHWLTTTHNDHCRRPCSPPVSGRLRSISSLWVQVPSASTGQKSSGQLVLALV